MALLQTPATQQPAVWAAALVCLALVPVFVLRAVVVVRSPSRLARRRRRVADHPVGTLVVRAFATVLAAIFAVCLAALALGVHPVFAAMLLAVLSAYGSAVWVWIRMRRPRVPAR